MTAIAIAAGGGGDAVTAAVLARKLPDLDVAAIMSFSWDRLMIDPVPGPRRAADFEGLIDHGGVHELTPAASLRTGGESTLPRLTRNIDLPILLIDIGAGVTGLAGQIVKAAAVFGADEVVVVDVGGDIIAAGHEPGLRSPLADSAVLAAAVASGLPSHILVAGVGLDGELSTGEANRRLARFEAREVAVLTPSDVVAFAPVWGWHPSEANGLLASAANGWRGSVETQRDSVVRIDDLSTHVYRVSAGPVAEDSLAALLLTTNTLTDIEDLLRDRRGYSDVDIERNRLTNRPNPRKPTPDALVDIDRYSNEAAARGVDALTVRRVLELANATDSSASESMRALLLRERAHRFQPPLYEVRGHDDESLPSSSYRN